MLAICGEYSWKVRSTASPDEILRTIKDEFRPRLRLPITTPSYAYTRLRVPSTTFTLTITVSPGPNTGLDSPPVRHAIHACSKVSFRLTPQKSETRSVGDRSLSKQRYTGNTK